jgi:type II secretory pathway component GspD/PulD (secretin)
LSLNLTLETLIGFRELSAGNQLGTIERPETQDQEFNSTVRLQAGETALVGGLIYESFSDSRTSIQGLEKYPVGSQNTTVTKNAMFILLRPTVTVYGPKQAGGKP